MRDRRVHERLRGSLVVVETRLQANQVGAALLAIDDGETATGLANGGTDPETIRLWHRLDDKATRLRVVLVARDIGLSVDVQVRSILAIPRAET